MAHSFLFAVIPVDKYVEPGGPLAFAFEWFGTGIGSLGVFMAQMWQMRGLSHHAT